MLRTALLIFPVLVTWTALAGSRTSATEPRPPLAPRSNYLVLDTRVVAAAENVRLAVGSVTKHPANPLFGEDRPWEVRFDNLYANIIHDREAGIYRCWYSPFIRDVSDKPAMENWDKISYGAELRKLRDANAREMGICYATSKDGIHWEKPELGLVEFNNSTANNLILRGPHGAGLFRDTRETDPQRPFKLFYKGAGSMKVRFSEDGLHWSPERPAAGIRVPGDTHNNAFWSPERKRYVGITRMKKGQRLVARVESEDFEHWTPAVEVMRGDVEKQTYAMPTFQQDDLYLGLVMILRRHDDRVHCELAWSPDTVNWQRIDPGTPLIPLSKIRGDYDWGCAYAAACPIVQPDGTIRIYYGASNGRHTSWRNGFLALAALRPDGWAGFVPADRSRPAFVRTAPLARIGKTLRVTSDAAEGGYVQVAALDKDGAALAQSEPLHGTSTAAPVQWPVGFSLTKQKGEVVQLEFNLRDAKLYAFRFTD
jgi:hypothetical protein